MTSIPSRMINPNPSNFPEAAWSFSGGLSDAQGLQTHWAETEGMK